MKIAKREDFSLLLLSYLARHHTGEYVSLSSIARETNLPPLFLKHLATRLKQKRIVESKEGSSGGYKLVRDPQKITVAQVIRAISDGVVTPSCKKGTCKVKKADCQCLSLWSRINRQVFLALQNINLLELSKL